MKSFKILLISLVSLACIGTFVTGCSPFQGDNEQQEEQEDDD